MIVNSIALFVLVAFALALGFWAYRNQTKRETDAQLSEWLGFLVKDKEAEPGKIPRVTTAELAPDVYDAVKLFINPKLKAEYNERRLKLENEIAARAIQIELAARRMAEGKPLSTYEDAILIREKLRSGEARISDSVELEFIPGRFTNSEEDNDQSENEI